MSDQPDVDLHHRPGLMELTPAVRRLVDTITAAGGAPYLVGGSVRDALLHPGSAPQDVDVEVFGLDVAAVSGALRAAFGQVDDVGVAFPMQTLRVGGEHFDVALPQPVPGGPADPHATVAAASARRDFTVNALYFDPASEHVLDPWGGLADLEAGVLRHVTGSTFTDDPLRVLRAARFAGRLGFAVHPDTIELARASFDGYGALARERVWKEWRAIATETARPSAVLEVLTATGWEAHYPQLAALHAVPQDVHWHPEGDVHVHAGLAADKAAELAAAAGLTGDDRTVVVLAALLHDLGKTTHTQIEVDDDGRERIRSRGHDQAGVAPATAFLRSIDAPRHLVQRIVPLIREHMVATGGGHPSRAAVRRLARRLQPATMTEWALVVAADKGGRGAGSVGPGTARWMELAREMGTERRPVDRILRGEHLIAAGMTPGPGFAPIMDDAVAAQDDGLFTDEAGALAWLSTRLAPPA